jgi:predicted Zn-dependent peptidase
MSRIARNELYFGKEIPLQDVLGAIEGVKADDIMRLSSMIFGKQELTCTGLGPLDKNGIDWAV